MTELGPSRPLLRNNRLRHALLCYKGFFLDAANDSSELQPETIECLRHGGSLRLCLNEVVALSEPTEHHKQLVTTRTT